MQQAAITPAIGAWRSFPAMRYLPVAGLALLLVACQTSVPTGDGLDGVSLQIGENGIGEPCRLVSSPESIASEQASSSYQIFCGRWTVASAEIHRTSDNADIRELLSRGWWRSHLNSQLNCGPAVPTSIFNEIPAAALDCSFRVGGWPYQALVTRIGEESYFVGSLPAAYPAVERALASLSGQMTPAETIEQGSLSGEIRRLEARLAGAGYSAGDLQQYRDLLRLAQYYNSQSLYPEAEERYRQALAIHDKVLPGDRGGRGFLYKHIALQLSNQERYREADVLFDKAESLLQYSLEPSDEATLVSYRAIHLANQRKDHAALQLARTATRLRRELAEDFGYDPAPAGGAPSAAPQTIGMAPGQVSAASNDALIGRGASVIGDMVQSLSVEAAMLVEVGELDQAGAILDEASAILAWNAGAPRRWQPKVLLLQARIAELRDDPGTAERLLLKAIDAQQGLFTQSRTEGQAYLALGRVYAGAGRAGEALESFRTGFAIIAERGGGLKFDDALAFFQTGLAEAQRNPAERQTIYAEMFQVSQMVRGPVTAQTMARTAARLATGDQEVSVLIRKLEDALRKRDELREQLTLAQADLNALAPQIEMLEKQWQATDEAIQLLEQQVQAAAPRYNQLIDTPISAQDVMRALQPGEALVQIQLGSQTSIGFFVTPADIEVYQIDITERQAKARVAALRSAFEPGDRLPEFPVEESYAFYQQLFAPLTGRLAGVDHLITVPSGPLLSLPFALFVTQPPPVISGRDYSQVAWLARSHALTLAPSVQSLVNLRQTIKPSQATKPLIGFGAFVPHRDPDLVSRSLGLPQSCQEEAILIANLSELPNTATEVRSIAASLGAPDEAVVLGSAFSEETVKRIGLSDYRIVYFATHGLLPYKLQCLPQPALALSRPAGSEIQGDGLLTTGEVVEEIILDADLVVLSACDTGGPGEETGGEALTGLARAFLYAGARSLLVSHWEVPDKPTMRLITGTFEQLSSRNLTLAEALQAGQLALIDSRSLSHPLAWAGFTVVGDGGLRLSPGLAMPPGTATIQATGSPPATLN